MIRVIVKTSPLLFILAISISYRVSAQDEYLNTCDSIFREMAAIPLAERIYILNDLDEYNDCARRAALKLSEQAKVERDSLVLSKVYAIMAYRTDPKYSLSYADSLIELSNHPEDYYFFDKNLIKGYVYYFLEQPLLASQEFEKTFDLAKEHGNFEMEVRAQTWIATIKEENNEKSQALELYFKTLELIEQWNPEEQELKDDLKSSVIQSIIILEINNKNAEKAELYLKELRADSRLISSKNLAQKTRIWDGKIAFLKKQYDEAYKILLSEFGKNHGSEELDILYTLISIQILKKNPVLESKHLAQFDSISSELGLPPIPESKNVYLSLLDNAIRKNDRVKQLEYYDKLIYIDSFLTRNKKESDLIEVPGYSIKDLKTQRDNLINNSKGKDYALLLFGVCLTVLIAISFYYIKKYQNAKRSLSDFIDSTTLSNDIPINSTNQTSQNEKEVNSPKDISSHPGRDNKRKINKEIEPSIKIALHKLNAWEEAKGYTNKDVDLNYLANLFKTNRTYISKAVNVYKNKTFRIYITDLRMDNFIETTKKNYNYKDKNLNTILEEFGFNSIDTFNRALKAKLNNNNITPSMYMNEIIKRNT
tara:strand:+ start:56787 stop:58568 length:1782 start_codon:yes stop_codon:yes gene_type:complete